MRKWGGSGEERVRGGRGVVSELFRDYGSAVYVDSKAWGKSVMSEHMGGTMPTSSS